MDKCIEVMRQSLELSTTIGEGLDHINSKFEAGIYEDALVLFEDIVEAFASIQNALNPCLTRIIPNNIETLESTLINTFQAMVTAYEQSDWGKARETMKFQLLPAYLKWKEELERCLGSYTAS